MHASVRSWIVAITVACTSVAVAAPGAPAPAGRADSVDDITKDAHQLANSGQYDLALAEILRGLVIAPTNLGLLGLKASVLFDKRAYLDALAAYQALVAAGLKGAKLREATKIIAMLEVARTTSLKVLLANGPAEVYVDSKVRGVVCKADPSCSAPELPGKYKVIVERPGCLPWATSVTVAAGTTTKISVTLTEKPSLLSVRVTQLGAHITVDDTDYAAPLTVPPGPHHVVVALAGHVDERREVAAHDGAPIDLDISLTPRVPVHIEPPGATLTLDDHPVVLQDGTLPVPPGDHVLIARAPGYDDGRLVIAPIHGELRLALKPTPIKRPPPPSPGLTPRRKLAIAAGSVGVAALAGGIVLGLAAKHDDRSAYELCPSATAPCASAAAAAAANDLNRRARSRAVEADLAFGAASAAAIGAAILWLTGAPESNIAVSAHIVDGTGIGAVVRF